MKIVICGSISAAEEIIEVRDKLEKLGHHVEIPEGVKNEFLRGRTEVATSEKANDKIKHDLIRGYYKKIANHDAVLVVNPKKKGIKNYIGGNTFLEMGFAHVLDKKLFVYYQIPTMSYSSEIQAMQPVVLSGDLERIQ
ncbi:hypothetical protein KKI22_04275 [Patescibacteria group bacterium]|nr:hypothetical protein [Patescibacteria group bacterium]